MKPRTLLFAALMSASPALVLAQPVPAPPLPASVVVAPDPPMVPVEAMVAVAPPTPAPDAPKAPKAPKAMTTPTAPVAVLAPPPPPKKRGQMINVRIEVTLSDSKGAPRVLTMTVADQESGMNRTTAVVVPGASAVDYSFNADASPEVVGDRIRLRLTADAVVPVEAEKPTAIIPKLALRQSQTVILNDGETVEIARAADPASSRTFILTVKATIQR